MSFTASIDEVVAENRNGLLSNHATWCRVALGDVAEVLNGFPFDSKRFVQSGGASLIRIRDVVRGSTETCYDGEIPDGYWVEMGEILIGMDGDFNIARWKSGKALLNQRVLKLSAKGYLYDEKFLFWVVAGYLQAINENTPSVTVKHLSSKTVLSIPLPLPPLAEQTRIAARLDELLAQVDTLKARIDGIPALLKRFRQSVLAAAVSGRLTEEWRVGRAAQATEEESTLPGWTQTVFGAICREITVGYVGKMADQYREEGVPFLRSQNVRPMRFSPENILYISEEFHSSIFKSRLEPGDLAVVRSGAPGVTCVIPESLPIANCSDLVIARPSERLSSWFGCIYMNSEVAQRNVADNQVGVAQQHFNVGSMKKMPINLPPLAEQTEIVRRVEQLFAFADQLEAKVNEAKTRIDRLTQSILAKAFRGELVPQDPNDEPASELLARIQAQRASAPKAKRGRKTSTLQG